MPCVCTAFVADTVPFLAIEQEGELTNMQAPGHGRGVRVAMEDEGEEVEAV